MREQFIPVVSPIGMGSSGETPHINADIVALLVAVALARKVIFMTDVDGVLSDGKELISYLDTATAETLITNKVILRWDGTQNSGAALDCVKANVCSAHIINGTDPHSVIAELFTDQGIGTQIVGAEWKGKLKFHQFQNWKRLLFLNNR